MVTNGQIQIANGMRSHGAAMGPGRLEVPGSPVVPVSAGGRAGLRRHYIRPHEDLERPGPDEYPLMVSVLLVKRSWASGLFGSLQPG
jgi:hypothetical protein